MLAILMQLTNRLRPREGWSPLLLTFIACLCAPAALLQLNQPVSSSGPLFLAALAVIVGFWLARFRLPAGVAAMVGMLTGTCLVVAIIGRLFPPLPLIWRESRYSVEWLRLGRQGLVASPLPFSQAADYSWQRLSDLGIRLWWWSQTAASGGTAQDPILLVLLTALLSWAFGLFAVWQIYRRWRPLIGLIPSGMGVGILAFFGGGMAIFYLLVFLFCTLWLLAICHLRTRVQLWERSGTDYPGGMGTELMLAAGPWLVGLLLLSAFLPVFSPRQIREGFWKLMDGPWSRVERMSERLFGPIEHSAASGADSRDYLPRSHLLSGSPGLNERVVLYVMTNDPAPTLPVEEGAALTEPPVLARYWRSVTYDTYTGSGWTNGPLEQRTSPSAEPLDPNLPPGFELHQQFDVLVHEGTLVFAANAPYQIDHPVLTWWRAPGDMAQLNSSANQYTVVSRPPEPSTSDLQTALAIPPPNLAERYLALPETIPQRVLDLAKQVVADADAQYDQARALEFFLRTYTYTLDVPLPPVDQDLVDYFLFDLQQGYCDYYASAMVVMARAVGIPARLATGYAQGTYDHELKRWVVLERDGHSWVEVYFDGIGWVEFEPTAGLPALTRTGGDVSGPSVPPLPPRPPREARFPWALLVIGGAFVLLTIFVAWIWWPGRQQADSAADLILNRQARLIRWGGHLGRPLRDGQTPFEYATTLSDTLRARGQDSRWPQVRQASAKAPADVEQLADAFVRTQYSREPISHREAWQIRDLWTRLRRHLLWLWLGRR